MGLPLEFVNRASIWSTNKSTLLNLNNASKSLAIAEKSVEIHRHDFIIKLNRVASTVFLTEYDETKNDLRGNDMNSNLQRTRLYRLSLYGYEGFREREHVGEYNMY